MSTEPTTQYPPKVAAALDLIREECIREGWLDTADLPDQAATYEYVTDSVYLPEPGTGHAKPGAGEFEDHGDASAHAYLIVLAWERGTELTPGDVQAAAPAVNARTGTESCLTTGRTHRVGGSVLAPICLDCEVLH